MKTILREILGLFVDDGDLALAILLWIAALALLAHFVPAIPAAILLFLGLAAILCESVTRFARKARH